MGNASSDELTSKLKYGSTKEQKELLSWLWEKAQSISGIKSTRPGTYIFELPIYLVDKEDLPRILCPEDPSSCKNLAAAYETEKKHIIIRSDVNPDDSIVNASFLLHELVHALQNETQSDDEMFGTCERLYYTEKQAYTAQDLFLKSEGAFFRASIHLRFFMCDGKPVERN